MNLLFYLTLLTTAFHQVVGPTPVAPVDGVRSLKAKPAAFTPIAILKKEKVQTEVVVLSHDAGSGGGVKGSEHQWTKAWKGKATKTRPKNEQEEEAALVRECLRIRNRTTAGHPRSRKVGQKRVTIAKRSGDKCDKFLRIPRRRLFWYACKHELKRARFQLRKLYWHIKAWWARREAAWNLFRLKLRWFFLRK